MYMKRLSYKEYGTWGQTNYDETYLLSNFALAYQKLYYVTYLFCMNDPILSATGSFNNPDHIKETIDTKRIKISRYN